MKKVILLAALAIFSFSVNAQETAKVKLYDTAANPKADIKKAIATGQKEHKNILLQVGGNWCIWCTRFHQTVASNDTLSKILHDNFITVHVNYDQYNKASDFWKTLNYPQRFGFPVFVILDENGKQIHTQNSAYLEEGKGYSNQKIAEFFNGWTPDAIAGKTIKR